MLRGRFAPPRHEDRVGLQGRPDAPDRGRGPRSRAGFTLVEALTALAIVAMLGLAVQRGVIQSRLGWLWIDDRVAAERVARSLLARPVNLAQTQAGGWSGTAEDGRAFTVRLSPVTLPLPDPLPDPDARTPAAPAPPGPGTAQQAPQEPPIRWVPRRQRIEVASGRGSLTIETIRLCPVEDGPVNRAGTPGPRSR
ncbi:PulJ/GspJ family protein [Methylobacterium sp. ID0610]|uniref:PulJ/GspJ family protein n=1 Tax=Methylobacterium carpenticola TaxID=3344827 RepID=UPI0036B53A8A